MSSRSSDVLLVALLMVTTVVGVFQFQTHQTLQAIQQQMVKQSPQGVTTLWPYDPRTMMPLTQPGVNPQPAPAAVTPTTITPPSTSGTSVEGVGSQTPKTTNPSPESTPKVENASNNAAKSVNPTEKSVKPVENATQTTQGEQPAVTPKPPVTPSSTAAVTPNDSAGPKPPVSPATPATTNTTNPATSGTDSANPTEKNTAAAASIDSVEKTTALTAAKAAASSAEAWKTYGPTATNVLTQLLKGELDKVYGQMDDAARQATPKPMFLESYGPYSKNHGGLKQVLNNQLLLEASSDSFVTFDVTIQTELSEKVVFCISMNSQKQVCSLWMK